MPQFSYTAIDSSGRRLHQRITADSKIEVANSLKKNNYFIVEISEVTVHNTKLPKRLKLSDKIFFTRNVATLLASGMSLAMSMNAIAEDTANKSAVNLYSAIRTDLERGFPFSKSLARYPDIFDSIYTSLVEAGENTGKLDEVMTSLADRLEKDSRIITQIRSAFLYPSFILIALVILGGLIMGFVIPKLIPVFTELKVQLPWTTKILLAVSQFMVNNPFVVLILTMIIAIAGILFFRSSRGKVVLTKLAHRTPLIKQMMRYLDLSRLSGTMALLLSAGVPIQKAIKISANTIRLPSLHDQIERTGEQLSTGSTLSRALRETTLPRTFIALVAVGERSGNIDFIFKTLATHYEDLLDTSVKNFTGMIEPVLTLIVGLIVGGTVLSVMVPIYQIVGTLGGGR